VEVFYGMPTVSNTVLGLLELFTDCNASSRKIPWRLSKFQKARQRKRLRAVDTVVATLDKALAKKSITTKAVERWKQEMPIEQEMVPKDKYTIFDRKEKKYRKSIRSELRRRSNRMATNKRYRASKVDKSITTSQPPWILSGIWAIRCWVYNKCMEKHMDGVLAWVYIRIESNGIRYHLILLILFHVEEAP
jgi:hypothetical protein